MWMWSTLYIVFCFSFYDVAALFNIENIGLAFDATKFIQRPRSIRNYTKEEAQRILADAQQLLNSSTEFTREEFMRKEEENMKEDLGTKKNPGRRQRTNSRRSANAARKRVKRQENSGGVGKFAEAAKTSNLKSLRIYLTMFKNLWSPNYVGGSHPLHPDVPKPVMILFKHRIMDFFFPPVGIDAVKT